jgi:hypothetical protein
MKITIDSKTGEVKVNGKLLKDAPEHYKAIAEYSLRQAYEDNYPLSDYEEDCMWMSYRYCIGRHTIASHMHANDIWKNCRGRMSKERELFTAFDINREIEDKLRFGAGAPEWHFPCTSLNRIYTPAIDIFCEFFKDFNIKSKEDYLKYYMIDVILADNERGYKIETTTWDEKLQSMIPVFKEVYDIDNVKDIVSFIKIMRQKSTDDVDSRIRWIIRCYPNPEYFYFNDIEDLFVWNDLVHCFDHEHHHKSILVDGTECEWFWTWTRKSKEIEDKSGKIFFTSEYEKIRVPIDKWNGSITTWIPDESIKEDIY